jgi:sec-independent protein translocase protein TatB
MFDIGFTELLLIAVVALVVLGPERLPKAARTLGHLFGRLQRYVNEVKADINREMELEELRKLQQTVQSAARDLETSMTNVAREVESGVRSVESGVRSVESEFDAVAAEATTTDASPPSAPALAEPAKPPASAQQQAVAPASNAPQQTTLPGFERI